MAATRAKVIAAKPVVINSKRGTPIPMTPIRRRLLTLALLFNLIFAGLAVTPAAADSRQPPIASFGGQPPDEPAALSPLEQMMASVNDGQAGAVRGVYVPGVLALKVLQQPEDQPTFVSRMRGTVTQFRYAQLGGVTGLLAHNTSSGKLFFSLERDQEVWLVYGDGARRGYHITRINRYQTLTPNDPYSDFLDLDTDALLSSGDLFEEMYWGGDRVVFQTCIAKEGNKSWGMLFVVAYPLEVLPPPHEGLSVE